MSKYLKIGTEIKDEGLFLDALREVCNEEGIEFEQGEDLSLYGYQGRERSEKADYVIRRRFVGRSANDLGFRRREDGSIEAIISEYDQRTRGQRIFNSVKRHYAVKAVQRAARRAGHTVREEQAEGNAVRLRIRV
jgi:hypothetical protein